MMMLSKQEIFSVIALAGAMLYPWQASAECQVIGGPNMSLNYDYQRDRAPGSPDPIAIVRFETQVRCEGESEPTPPQLLIGDTVQGYVQQTTPHLGSVNMLMGGQDSVGFRWRNSISGKEALIALGQGHPATRTLKADGETIWVNDTVEFFYVGGSIEPGRDIAPTPLRVNYKGASGLAPLYELVFPAIPMFARACSVSSQKMDIDFGNVNMDDIGKTGEQPSAKVVRQHDLQLTCDPGTNVGFRITPAKQLDNHTLLGSDTLDSAAKGVGLKMRYHNLARNQHDIRFGETLQWGRTSETRSHAAESLTIPFEFYLVRTEENPSAGKFEAQATLELRHE